MELRVVPLEESRSWRLHFPGSDTIARCFEEIPASFIGTLLPRTTRPIRTVDPGLNSRVSPSLGPRTIVNFSIGGSIGREKRFGCLKRRFEVE